MNPIIRINDLIDQHGESYISCAGCPICKEIETLGKSLERSPEEKFKHILDKGPDMTKSDIAFLLENDVQGKHIQKALKIGPNKFYEIMRNFGFAKRGEDGMAKLTIEEYQDLKAKGLTDKQIAERKQITPAYVSQLKKQWFKPAEKQPPKTEYEHLKKQVKEKATANPQFVKLLQERIAELEEQVKAYPALMERAAKLETENMKLQEETETLRLEIYNLNKSAEDTEIELDKWREEARLWKREHDNLDSAYKTLSDILKANREENKAIKAALKAVL